MAQWYYFVGHLLGTQNWKLNVLSFQFPSCSMKTAVTPICTKHVHNTDSGLLISRSLSRFFDALSNSFQAGGDHQTNQATNKQYCGAIKGTRYPMPVRLQAWVVVAPIQLEPHSVATKQQDLFDGSLHKNTSHPISILLTIKEQQREGENLEPPGLLAHLACCACLRGQPSCPLQSVPDPNGYSTWGNERCQLPWCSTNKNEWSMYGFISQSFE